MLALSTGWIVPFFQFYVPKDGICLDLGDQEFALLGSVG